MSAFANPVPDDRPDVDRLDDLLGRIGAELDRLAERLSHVGMPDSLATGQTELPAAQIIALQSVDQAEQTLRELALVLRRTAACDVAAAAIDLASLARDLPLAHTAAVILGVEAVLDDGGELDLF